MNKIFVGFDERTTREFLKLSRDEYCESMSQYSFFVKESLAKSGQLELANLMVIKADQPGVKP
jgi:hypothetical protein